MNGLPEPQWPRAHVSAREQFALMAAFHRIRSSRVVGNAGEVPADDAHQELLSRYRLSPLCCEPLGDEEEARLASTPLATPDAQLPLSVREVKDNG